MSTHFRQPFFAIFAFHLAAALSALARPSPRPVHVDCPWDFGAGQASFIDVAAEANHSGKKGDGFDLGSKPVEVSRGEHLLSNRTIRAIQPGAPALGKSVDDDFTDKDSAHPEPPPADLKQSPAPGGPAPRGENVLSRGRT